MISNKIIFCIWNSLKIAGTAEDRRKNGISSFSQVILDRFSWFFAQWCKMAMAKMCRSPIFVKTFFSAARAGNGPKKTVLLYFLEILSLVFSHRRTFVLPKMCWIPFSEKNYWRSVEPEICRKSPFFPIFMTFFINLIVFLRKMFLIVMSKI